MTPTLRQLEYALAVATELSFRKAAERCHVSQPALSAQIQQLETLLGVQLFERDKRRVLLTDAGRTVAAEAQSVLAGVERLVDAVRAHTRPLVGPLSLGAIPTIAPYLLPRAVPRVRERHPELDLYLREAETRVLVEQIGAGELDLGLLALEAELGDLAVLRLFTEPFLVATPPGHPFAELDAVAESALADEQLLILAEGHCLRSQALSICESAGAHDIAPFEATSLVTLIEMVAGGLGITLLPEMALPEAAVAAGRLVVRPFAGEAPQRTIGLAWRSSTLRRSEFELLGEILATL